MSTMFTVLSICMMLIQSIQGQLGVPGGWSEMTDLSRVQVFAELAQPEIVSVLKLNGYNLAASCQPQVQSAEQQVCVCVPTHSQKCVECHVVCLYFGVCENRLWQE